MTPRVKWAGSLLVGIATLLAVFYAVGLAIRFERYVMASKHVKLTAWSSY